MTFREPHMFKRVHAPEELLRALLIRAIVFMEEQGVSCSEEMDGHDFGAVHILGEVDGEPVACGRIRFQSDRAFLQRLAVRQAWRKKKLGSALLTFMLDECRAEGFHRFELHAQTRAMGFYRKHGFVAIGEEFEEAGIPHVHMRLEDPRPR